MCKMAKIRNTHIHVPFKDVVPNLNYRGQLLMVLQIPEVWQFFNFTLYKKVFKNLHIFQISTAKHILHIHADVLARLYYSTVQYSTVQYSIAQCSVVQCSVVQCSVVQYSIVQCSIVQYSIVQYSIVQYSIVQYSIVQYSAEYRSSVYWQYCHSHLTLLQGCHVGIRQKEIKKLQLTATPCFLCQLQEDF